MTNRSIVARTARIAAQAAIGFACGVALVPAMANAEPVAAKAAAPATAATVAMDRRVCLRDVPTGSHIAVKVCKTRGEWIEQTGIDPLAKK